MPTTETGAMSQNVDPALQKDNIASRTPITEKPVSARDQLLMDMDARIEQQRQDDDETFYQSADPRALAMAAEMRAESGEGPVDHNGRPRDPSTGRFTADAGADGDPYSEGNADIEQPVAARTQVDARGNDPLEEYVVREQGKPPMFKTVVNGQTQLIPLDRARAQLQKHMSAEIRLRAAADVEKNLAARERNIQSAEAQLRNRQAAPVIPVDDASLDQEATNLVRSLLSDPEATAAGKMATVLKKIRAATPQVDVNAISRQAVAVAKQEIAAEDNRKALVGGLSEFTAKYQNIVADPDLYALADRKTEAIAQEHPDWTPAQVMLEAGKQTMDWVGGLRGKRTTQNNGGDLNRRQQLKQNLTPMPQSRSVRPAATADANDDTSPQSAMSDIRKARGQAY